MADYCGECAVWLGSQDVNRYGERWCSYSRRYEKSDQNTYGCRGFVQGARHSGGGCFLTTACVSHKGLPDNCRELTAMRRLRDEWLRHQPGGQAEIDRYYRIAPGIVEKIKARPDRSSVLDALYNDHILPCTEAVEAGEMEKAYRLYKNMIQEMEA